MRSNSSLVFKHLGFFKIVLTQCVIIVDFQAAIDAFQQLEKLDPYRLTNVDTYSNVLFVKVVIEVEKIVLDCRVVIG